MTKPGRKRKRSAFYRQRMNLPAPPCPNCGEPGAHFVPPSFGDRGFYMCKPRARK